MAPKQDRGTFIESIRCGCGRTWEVWDGDGHADNVRADAADHADLSTGKGVRTAPRCTQERTVVTAAELRALYPSTMEQRVEFTRQASAAHKAHKANGGSEPVILAAFNLWKQEGSPMDSKKKAGAGSAGRARAGRSAVTDEQLVELLVKHADGKPTNIAISTQALRKAGYSVSGGRVRVELRKLIAAGTLTLAERAPAAPKEPKASSTPKGGKRKLVADVTIDDATQIGKAISAALDTPHAKKVLAEAAAELDAARELAAKKAGRPARAATKPAAAPKKASGTSSKAKAPKSGSDAAATAGGKREVTPIPKTAKKAPAKRSTRSAA